jgi:hypothetical protein
MYQDALNDLKDQGYSDSTREGINRTGRMIFRKALELELIKKDSTEFAYVKKNKKTIEQLEEEEEEVPKYLEKEALALFLDTVKIMGWNMITWCSLSFPTLESESVNWLLSSGKTLIS